MPAFAQATAVDPQGDGRYRATIAEGWDIGGRANGGYLLAMCARAATVDTGHPDPLTVTGHFLAPGPAGPAELIVDTLRRGRRHSTSSVRLLAEGRLLVSALVTCTDLSAADGPEAVSAEPVELPPVEECVPSEVREGAPALMDRIELRLHPDDSGFSRGRPSGQARVRGWFRLRDDEMPDTCALVLATDAFPPTIFNTDLPMAWTPTVELTSHQRRRPEAGWLRCSFTTRFITGGYLEEDGEVWDSRGRLIAQSRQIALVPRG